PPPRSRPSWPADDARPTSVARPGRAGRSRACSLGTFQPPACDRPFIFHPILETIPALMRRRAYLVLLGVGVVAGWGCAQGSDLSSGSGLGGFGGAGSGSNGAGAAVSSGPSASGPTSSSSSGPTSSGPTSSSSSGALSSGASSSSASTSS